MGCEESEPKPINRTDGEWAEEKPDAKAGNFKPMGAKIKRNYKVFKNDGTLLYKSKETEQDLISSPDIEKPSNKEYKVSSALDKYGDDYQTIYERGGMRRLKD